MRRRTLPEMTRRPAVETLKAFFVANALARALRPFGRVGAHACVAAEAVPS
jgi:hypothetical protein